MRKVLLLVLFGVSCGAVCLGQSPPPLSVNASFAERRPVRPDESIELHLSRPLQDPEMSLAVLIGTTDVSSLFTIEKLRLRYNAKLWQLPLGKSELTLHVITKTSEWKEVARLILFVAEKTEPPVASFLQASFAHRFPTDDSKPGQTQPDPKKGKWQFLPSLTIGLKTQPAQSTTPATNSGRLTFADMTMQASLRSEASYGFFNSQSSFDLAGSTFQQEALRFGTLGNEAPKVDLASYILQFQTGDVKYQVGHFGYGTQRHLINGFSSRGVNVTIPFLKRFEFSGAAMNGTQIVGYENIIGLSRRRHQMFSATMGIEIFPKRAGALRVEVAALSAYFQPLSGVNRGVITDLQRSRGLSFRLIGSDNSSRLRFEGGFTRSFFASPGDVTLEQGVNVVALPALSRNAHYLEASYEVLRNFSLTKSRKANLSLSFREENVAPLFRSLGASTQADKIQFDVAVSGSIDEISSQFSYSNFHDNLKNIPSILRTINGSTNFSIAAPAKALLNRTNDSAWLPRLGYSFSRIHSTGAAIPVNGGFELDLGSIPDLIATNQSFTADWQFKKFTVGYNVNRSFQNNEQVGRELADQRVLVNTGRFGVAVTTKFNVNVDLSAESSANKETGRIDRTYRTGPGISWQLTKAMGLNASFSNTIAGDVANTSYSRNSEFDAAWTYRFGAGKEGLKKVAGQFFIRYANRYSHSLERIFLSDTLNKNQTLTANLSFTFF